MKYASKLLGLVDRLLIPGDVKDSKITDYSSDKFTKMEGIDNLDMVTM